ncbi:MAG: phosphatase PAP2 family protein [Alphaproteobacteria bacterium]|nr:phosphatase PAP2 family protein [Alphaproteobacteria bacterium]
MSGLKKLLLLVLIVFNIRPANAKSAIEEAGDYLQVIVPAYAFGMAMNEKDWTGAKQFGYSFGAMQAGVLGLKTLIDEERPDKSDNRSFPSGHTASAFSGATFIHKRYGIERAIVPYLMAGFTGYSRVHADKHHWHDVAAGAAISGLFTWTFVDKESNFQVSADPGSVNLGFRTEF